MELYLIQYTMRINGVDGQIEYHETIKESTSLDTNNVYVEHITSDLKFAKMFYEKEEAEKVANLFAYPSFKTHKILTIKR